MIFESPLWLFGLLPWAATFIYLLPGRRQPATVSFLMLWKGSASPARRAAWRRPRLASLLAMLALLLAILAAGHPAIDEPRQVNGPVTIVLDRGATMSLPSASGKPFRDVLDLCAARLRSAGNEIPVSLAPTPGTAISTTHGDWKAIAEALPPTAIPVDLQQVVADQLRRTRGSIFVLSDQPVRLADRRIVQIFPEPVEDTVAITATGASQAAHPQLMLRLENHSNLSSVDVSIRTSGNAIHHSLPLPPRNQSADRFVDLAEMGSTLIVQLDLRKTSPWSQANLARQSSGVVIAVDPSVDDSVRRIARIYSDHRPAAADAKQVIVSSRPLPAGQAGICVIRSLDERPPGAGAVIRPHPITLNVDRWIAGDSTPPPPGFLQLVSIGSLDVVAVRDEPTRQVWLNTNLREWDKTSDFVIFSANLFDWIAAGNQVYSSTSPAALDGAWHRGEHSFAPFNSVPGEWPGIYQSNTGSEIAVNAGAFPNVEAVHIMQKSPVIGRDWLGPGWTTGAFIFTALLFLFLAALFWPT